MPFRLILLKQSRGRLAEFLREIDRVSESEFPYEQSRASLGELRLIFENKLARLNQLDGGSDPAIVKQECALALNALFLYLPMLGIILRSTQVRNAFEVYGPLLRIARQILDRNPSLSTSPTQLVFSSGWEYSPFIFPDVPDLPGYALIEFPAPESGNPLLIPLAGHELGHSLWLRQDLPIVFSRRAHEETVNAITARIDGFTQIFRLPSPLTPADLTTDTSVMQVYEQSENWLICQAEESFCDFVGLRIFGIAYLEAFCYLLAPKLSSTRSENYPNNVVRASNLLEAARTFGITPPSGYEALFENDVEPGYNDGDRFLIEVSDQALRGLIPDLIKHAGDLINGAGISLPEESNINAIVDRYKDGVPADNSNGLPDIINAAWRAFHHDDLWTDLHAQGRDKNEILKDLVIKNIEIFEIEQKLKEPLP